MYLQKMNNREQPKSSSLYFQDPSYLSINSVHALFNIDRLIQLPSSSLPAHEVNLFGHLFKFLTQESVYFSYSVPRWLQPPISLSFCRTLFKTLCQWTANKSQQRLHCWLAERSNYSADECCLIVPAIPFYPSIVIYLKVYIISGKPNFLLCFFNTEHSDPWVSHMVDKHIITTVQVKRWCLCDSNDGDENNYRNSYLMKKSIHLFL